MKVLVTGGAGYIGSHCVSELISKGYEVVVVDNLQTGHIEAIHKKALFHKGDIRDKVFLDGVFKKEKIEAVIHFAANSLVGESMINPLKYYDNNVYGMNCLLDVMNKNNCKKIVFSSTAATYGEPKNIPILETDDTIPTNTYGETKLAMEKMMMWCDKAYGIKYVSLRYFNVAGANGSNGIGEDHNPETHLIPLILQVPLGKREFILIFGNDYNTLDGTCIRDYIHISDLINAHILSLESLINGKESNTFNLGSGKGYSVLEMIESARKVTNHPIPSKIGNKREGDPEILIASSLKIEKELGWKRKHNNIEEIIESAWSFHQKFPNGFKD